MIVEPVTERQSALQREVNSDGRVKACRGAYSNRKEKPAKHLYRQVLALSHPEASVFPVLHTPSLSNRGGVATLLKKDLILII